MKVIDVRSRAICLLSIAVLVQACGAASESRPPQSPSAYGPAAEANASTPSGQPGKRQPGQAQPGYPGQPAQPGYPGQAAPSPPPSPGMAARSEHIRSFYQHGVELEQAGADCRSACRALGAMDRAAGELCEIDGHDGICKDAEGRVRDARDKVRGACGTCPDGVSLERNAPVPSRP